MRRIIALFLSMMLLAAPSLAHPSRQDRVQMQLFLERLFRYVDDEYFDGNLPPTTVKYAPIADDDLMGLTLCNGDGSRCEILISPKWNTSDKVAASTLLHEMCHAATIGKDFDHGPKWHTCMRNLAKEGAFDDIW